MSTKMLFQLSLDGEKSDFSLESKDSQKIPQLSLDDDEKSDFITLVSKDNQKISIKRKYANISFLIQNVMGEDEKVEEIEFKNISSTILGYVQEYMEHHEGKEPRIIRAPLKSENMKENCDDVWDAEFIDRVGEKRDDLNELILAANYMDINSLLYLSCAKVSSLLKGKKAYEIKKILNIPENAKNEKSIQSN